PGETLNPDGDRNEIEGGIQQSASWTLLEELRHKDGRVMTTSWDKYPIATFRDAPRSLEVLVEGDAIKEPTGVGEPGAVPMAAAAASFFLPLGYVGMSLLGSPGPSRPPWRC